MRLLVLAALAASLGACSTTEFEAMRANPREYFNLTAPTLQTDERVDGQQVPLKRGQALVVRLEEHAASGQRWQMLPLPQGAVIAPVQHDYVAKPGNDPAATGVPGEAVFRVRAVATGTQPVILEYRGSEDTAAAKTIRFEVVVR